MSGPVALHGGAEFQSGDEPFLAALLDAAAPAAGGGRPIRVAVVPTAAGRGRPDLAAATGVAAFERVAAGRGIDVAAAAIGVLNHATASDPELAAWLAAADVIHFPGGDPDLIPTVMPGTAAWAAITDAHVGGAVLAGASAGAMAFASWTWTPGGGMAGLMVVRGLVVVPHLNPATWTPTIERFAAWAPRGSWRARAVREDRRDRGAGHAGERDDPLACRRPRRGALAARPATARRSRRARAR